MSVFYLDQDGRVFHTDSAYERGIDMINTAYHYLELVPEGPRRGGGNQSGSAATTSTAPEHHDG